MRKKALFTVTFAFLFVFGLSFLFTLSTAAQQAPIAGRNVNMVSGTSYPGGDPFLQRQNEVSIAVSTRNVQHLLAGANDYRSVDLPGINDPLLTDADAPAVADAWLGLFKSMDGGSSWKSILIPGFPQDNSVEGLAAPIKGFTTATDPIVRAGPNGMFYYGGIAFNRDDKQKGVFFVARFIDNNNKETGDSIRYLGMSAVDYGASGRFEDKPWLAVDVPRAGAGTCSIQTTQDQTQINQSFPAGNVYVANSEFVGNDINIKARILFSRSTDCGATFSNPFRITEGSPILQGPTVAIDPNTGYVYVAWRQVQELYSNGTVKNPDSIWIAKSVNQGASFSSPVLVAQITPFDQDTNDVGDNFRQFRTLAFPTMAVDASGRVYVAWSQYGVGADGGARVVITTSLDGLNWSGRQTVLTDSPPSPKGHQIMPSLTFTAGKLMLTYYDFRADLALLPPPAGLNVPGSANIADPIITSGRPYLHTMDARVAQADPSDTPLFVSTQMSKYLFDAVIGPQGTQFRQLQFNPPDLPLFAQGTKPFMGDYIDIAAPNFVFANGQWTWNTAPSNSSILHAAWADNRDVKAPPEPYDWTKYTATGAVAGTPSVFDPTVKQPAQCVPSLTGMRDQNVYTSQITQGLVVTIPGNSKPLGLFQRAYVVSVQNTTRPNPNDFLSSIKYFRLSIQQPLPAGTIASFLQFGQRNSIDVAIPARSSIARSVFVTSTDPHAAVTVNVQEIASPGAPAPLPGGLASTAVINPDILNPNILNPDILNPNILNPDILNAEVYNPDIVNTVEITSVQDPNILNPNILNPDILNPDILNPDILNPDILNPNILNPNILNPNILNPDILNPNILNPDILNPNILNSSLADVKDIIWTVNNRGNTTSAFAFKNFLTRNTTDFAFQLLVYKIYATAAQSNCQSTETAHEELIVNIQNPNILNPDILNPNILNPNILNPNILNPDILNATFYLAPYETAKVALRVIDQDKTDNKTITVNGQPLPTPTPGVPLVFPIESIQIAGADLNAAIVAQEVNTEDAARGITTPPAATARLTIITQELPSGQVGKPYIAQLVADAGTRSYTWTLIAGAGAQPNSIGNSGLTLNSDGSITGTPTTSGSFPFSVQVTDTAAHFDRRDLVIAVLPAAGASLVVVSQPNPCIDAANPEPTCVVVNQIIVPKTSVKVFDATGAVVAGVNVTLSIASGPAGAVLGGTLTQTTNASGVAAFDDLTVNKPGTYKLSATANGFAVASTGNFNVLAQPFFVSSMADTGAGSLRQAMADANTVPGAQIPQILFNFPGSGPYVITPQTPLPPMTRPVSIDATTQPGYAGHPIVQINGTLVSSAANGFALLGGSSLIRGFAIGGFDGNSILLQNGGGNRIAGNYINTNIDGTAPFGVSPWVIGGNAIKIQDSANNIIGGTVGTTPGGPCTGDCNVLITRAGASNSIDVRGTGLSSTGNQILGNFIGTNAAGTSGLAGPNSAAIGVVVDNIIVGDGTPAGRNVISGNGVGVDITVNSAAVRGNYIGTNSAGNAAIVNAFGGTNNNAGIELNGGGGALVEGNLVSGNAFGIDFSGVAGQDTLRGNTIGLNAAGNAAIPNGIGIHMASTANSTIGGTTPADRNVISGNTQYGIQFSGGVITGNSIIGNYIGTDGAGTGPIPNGSGGILFNGASSNFIGGAQPGQLNTIAFNNGPGIAIPSGINNQILSNSIFSNTGIGIDLGDGTALDGVTLNDAGDGDTGGNNRQNFPVITSASPSTVNGTLNSSAGTLFTIQLFKNNVCNASGYGEGQTLIASFTAATDGMGNLSFSQGGLALANGQYVTGTATDPSGNTSEFSSCVAVGG
jgi:hypothetical protein